ncbi:hypothetical protein ACQ4PT_026859 [Festuca glaucescens]
MALASFTASLPIAAATAVVRTRAAVVRRAMSSSSSVSGSQARVGVVQMTSVGDLDANYATCSRLTKASPSLPSPNPARPCRREIGADHLLRFGTGVSL